MPLIRSEQGNKASQTRSRKAISGSGTAFLRSCPLYAPLHHPSYKKSARKYRCIQNSSRLPGTAYGTALLSSCPSCVSHIPRYCKYSEKLCFLQVSADTRPAALHHFNQVPLCPACFPSPARTDCFSHYTLSAFIPQRQKFIYKYNFPG